MEVKNDPYDAYLAKTPRLGSGRVGHHSAPAGALGGEVAENAVILLSFVVVFIAVLIAADVISSVITKW